MAEETAIVRLNVSYGAHFPGERASFPVAECQRLINNGSAVLADPNLDSEEVGIISDGDESVATDNATHELNVAGVIELVESINDMETLQKVWNGELVHPEYEGGRHGALKALRARAKLLKGEDDVEEED